MFSPAVRLFHPHDPHLRTETFYLSDFFKGRLLLGGTVTFRVQQEGKKINVTFRELIFSGGRGAITFRILWHSDNTIMLMYNILLFSFRNNQPHTFLPFKTCETLHCLWACIVCLFLSCTVYAMHMNLLQKVSISLFLSPHPHTKKTHLQPLWKFHFSFRFTFKSVLSTPIKISNYYLLG